MYAGVDPATVLVVEDDAVLGQVLGRILMRDGHVVRHALNASQAQAALDECAPRLVLLDASLRDGSGMKLADELRRRFPRLPIILLTPHSATESDFPGWGRERLMSKSINLPELRRTVAGALVIEDCQEAVLSTPLQSERSLVTPHDVISRPVLHPNGSHPKGAQPNGSHSNGARLPTEAGREPEALTVDVAAGAGARAAVRSDRTAQETSMRWFESKRFRIAAGLIVAVCLVVALAANGAIRLPVSSPADSVSAPDSPGSTSLAAVSLVAGQPHTLFVPEDVRTALGIRKNGVDIVAAARVPTETRPLVMPGSTLLDPTHIMRVKALFAPSPSSARVIEIGQIKEDPGVTGTGQSGMRELRSGDRVVKGNLLAAFYSVDVGNQKNNLIDAIIQLKLDEQVLKAASARSEVIPAVTYWQFVQKVESDQNNIDRAVNTLRTWEIAEDVIQSVRNEAEKIKADDMRSRRRQHTKADFDRWARVEIRASDDGIILERNVTLHETVADPTTSLFQIAKLDAKGAGPRLLVTANCPEDQLPLLDALPTGSRRWTITTVGSPPISGFIDDIGYLIDPNQHTGVVKGHLENKEGRIRGTQFASAKVELPPPRDVVVLPSDAVIDDGQQSIVFVQTDAEKQHYTMRRVELTNRFDKTVFVRSKPFDKSEERTPEEIELGMLPKEPLRPGERVLRSGVGELKIALLDRESEPHHKAADEK